MTLTNKMCPSSEKLFHSFIEWLLYKIVNIGLAVRVFASGPGDLGSIPGWVLPKTQKIGTWCLFA